MGAGKGGGGHQVWCQKEAITMCRVGLCSGGDRGCVRFPPIFMPRYVKGMVMKLHFEIATNLSITSLFVHLYFLAYGNLF